MSYNEGQYEYEQGLAAQYEYEAMMSGAAQAEAEAEEAYAQHVAQRASELVNEFRDTIKKMDKYDWTPAELVSFVLFKLDEDAKKDTQTKGR